MGHKNHRCGCGSCNSCRELASYNQTNRTINVPQAGLSAYELAVQLGYEGTLEEWLDSQTGVNWNTDTWDLS